jgi:serine/threonine protein kinase
LLLYSIDLSGKGDFKMNVLRVCPDCESELPSDAPEGLCPKCLLHSGLLSPSGGSISPGRLSFLAPSPAEIAVHFPQLEIIELLGQGGMGAVYKARQVKLDRLVALKILPQEACHDTDFQQRFAREAKALAKLSHPNIVGIHDFGEAGGYFYFLMEYVDGANLRSVFQTGRLSPEDALAIVPQICDALQYAHEAEIVHRDIKPENILLDAKGHVKIADFGLAKLIGPTPADLHLTGSRQIMGTPHYMAPEQMEKPQTVDHRADIYSLGVVFYEMLTGELPLGRFAPPSRKAKVDARLDHVILKALEKEPEARFQRVSEMKGEIEGMTSRFGDQLAGIGPTHSTWEEIDREVIRQRMVVPAAGLMFTGVLAFVSLNAISIPRLIEESRRYYVGLLSHPSTPEWVPLLGLLIFCVTAAAGGFLVLGGLKMLNLKSHETAVIACLWAMIPWNPVFPLGLFFGLFAYRRLRRPEVYAAFKGRGAFMHAPLPEPKRGKIGSFFASMRSFVAYSSPPVPMTPPPLAGRPVRTDIYVPKGETAKPATESQPAEASSDPKAVKTSTVQFGLAIVEVGAPILIGVAMGVTQSAHPLWFLVLLSLVASCDQSDRESVIHNIAVILGIVISLILIGYGIQVAHSLEPLWALIPVGISAGVSLGVSGSSDTWWKPTWPQPKEKTEEAKREDKIFAAASKYEIGTFTWHDEIDGNSLPKFRREAHVPNTERVLGIFDLTGNDDGDSCIVLCTEGMYIHNPSGAAHAGHIAIPYAQLPERTFVNHGNSVYLGADQFIDVDPDSVDGRQVVGFMVDLQKWAIDSMTPPPSPENSQ